MVFQFLLRKILPCPNNPQDRNTSNWRRTPLPQRKEVRKEERLLNTLLVKCYISSLYDHVEREF